MDEWKLAPNVPLCIAFDMALPGDTINAVVRYLENTPEDQISVAQVTEIAGRRPTSLVWRGRMLISGNLQQDNLNKAPQVL